MYVYIYMDYMSRALGAAAALASALREFMLAAGLYRG